MVTYTYSKARQNFASLLNKAKKEGKVRIKRRDGSLFELKAISNDKSLLDVDGIDIGISADEILTIIKESRNSYSKK